MKHGILYPRPETGLAKVLLTKAKSIFTGVRNKDDGIYSRRCGKRGPLYEGLPTLENIAICARLKRT